MLTTFGSEGTEEGQFKFPRSLIYNITVTIISIISFITNSTNTSIIVYLTIYLTIHLTVYIIIFLTIYITIYFTIYISLLISPCLKTVACPPPPGVSLWMKVASSLLRTRETTGSRFSTLMELSSVPLADGDRMTESSRCHS